MSTTDLELAEEMKRLCGGCITVVREKRVRKPHWKQAWRWALSGAQQNMRIMREIAPLLRCPKKRKRVEFIVANYSQVSLRNGFYTDEDRAKKIAFQEQFFAIDGR